MNEVWGFTLDKWSKSEPEIKKHYLQKGGVLNQGIPSSFWQYCVGLYVSHRMTVQDRMSYLDINGYLSDDSGEVLY
jgi:hypothetical protein